ncbi:MAG: indole-3-glycerol phosphate synthase TrpC [Muribaculaceae bacterium]
MADILEKIIADKRLELERIKAEKPLSALYEELDYGNLHDMISMREALLKSRTGIIAEFKRRSPSKGWINPDADPVQTAKGYAKAGATAISVLTDEKYFGGSLQFLKEIRSAVNLPLLRKEFIIDEYQLLEARIAGADAVLLIAAALSKQRCRELTTNAHIIGLEVLLEIHDCSELDYIDTEPDMIGVNNRKLSTFQTDVQQSFSLAANLPADACLVSESGISQPDVVRKLRSAGFRGFLIGETFMRQESPSLALKQFKTEIRCK